MDNQKLAELLRTLADCVCASDGTKTIAVVDVEPAELPAPEERKLEDILERSAEGAKLSDEDLDYAYEQLEEMDEDE